MDDEIPDEEMATHKGTAADTLVPREATDGGTPKGVNLADAVPRIEDWTTMMGATDYDDEEERFDDAASQEGEESRYNGTRCKGSVQYYLGQWPLVIYIYQSNNSHNKYKGRL